MVRRTNSARLDDDSVDFMIEDVEFARRWLEEVQSMVTFEVREEVGRWLCSKEQEKNPPPDCTNLQHVLDDLVDDRAEQWCCPFWTDDTRKTESVRGVLLLSPIDTGVICSLALGYEFDEYAEFLLHSCETLTDSTGRLPGTFTALREDDGPVEGYSRMGPAFDSVHAFLEFFQKLHLEEDGEIKKL